MVELRAKKIDRIAEDIPPAKVTGPQSGDVLVIGWGSSYGAIAAATGELQREGHAVAHLHLRYIRPLPRGLNELFSGFQRLLVVEGNTGQLKTILRDHFSGPFEQFNQIEGRPFLIREVRSAIEELMGRD